MSNSTSTGITPTTPSAAAQQAAGNDHSHQPEDVYTPYYTTEPNFNEDQSRRSQVIIDARMSLKGSSLIKLRRECERFRETLIQLASDLKENRDNVLYASEFYRWFVPTPAVLGKGRMDKRGKRNDWNQYTHEEAQFVTITEDDIAECAVLEDKPWTSPVRIKNMVLKRKYDQLDDDAREALRERRIKYNNSADALAKVAGFTYDLEDQGMLNTTKQQKTREAMVKDFSKMMKGWSALFERHEMEIVCMLADQRNPQNHKVYGSSIGIRMESDMMRIYGLGKEGFTNYCGYASMYERRENYMEACGTGAVKYLPDLVEKTKQIIRQGCPEAFLPAPAKIRQPRVSRKGRNKADGISNVDPRLSLDSHPNLSGLQSERPGVPRFQAASLVDKVAMQRTYATLSAAAARMGANVTSNFVIGGLDDPLFETPSSTNNMFNNINATGAPANGNHNDGDNQDQVTNSTNQGNSNPQLSSDGENQERQTNDTNREDPNHQLSTGLQQLGNTLGSHGIEPVEPSTSTQTQSAPTAPVRKPRKKSDEQMARDHRRQSVQDGLLALYTLKCGLDLRCMPNARVAANKMRELNLEWVLPEQLKVSNIFASQKSTAMVDLFYNAFLSDSIDIVTVGGASSTATD